MNIDFGEWLPDLPAYLNRGALVAENVVPGIKSYRSLRGHQAFASALSDRPVGGIWARSTLGDIYNIIGTETGIFRVEGTTVTDLTQAGGYSVTEWDFEQFGNRILATGGIGTPVQFFDLDSNPTINFEDLPGSPPEAQYLGVVRDFVILGDVEIDGNRQRDTLYWSGYNNTELWTPSIVTQSGFVPLRGKGGEIRRVISGRVGTIFMEQSIFRFVYDGPPRVFRSDEITVQMGTPASWSVARTGDMIFFYTEQGFQKLNVASGAIDPIGRNRVDRTFLADIDAAEIPNMRAVVDRKEQFVLWLYSSGPTTFFDRYIAYSWASDRWAGGAIDISFAMEFASSTVSLDELDAVLGHDVDGSATFSVDSNAFPGGAVATLVFNELFEAGTLSGEPLRTQIDTAEFSKEDKMLFIRGVRPLLEGLAGESTITPITRNRLTDNPVVGQASPINDIGQADIRSHARYHRYRLDTSQFYEHAAGCELEPTVKGKR